MNNTSLLPIFLPEETVREPQARLTVVQSVYHNIPGEQPNGPDSIRYSRLLDSVETAYSRTIKVGEEWKPLDIGWLKDIGCSYLVLENDSKRPPGVTPTKEEKEEWAAKVIEYGIEVDHLTVVPTGYLLPEEGTGYSPLSLDMLRIRCRRGEGKLTYFAVPM